MRMILQALAQVGISKEHIFQVNQSSLHQFHGAWMVWMRGAVGMGEKTKEEVKIQNTNLALFGDRLPHAILKFFDEQVLFLYKSVIPEWRWMHKSVVKKVLNPVLHI